MASIMPAPVPKIDFTGLDPAAGTGDDRWCAARAQVMQALDSHGCFVAVYDKITPELVDAVFETSAKELFGLPLEAKIRNVSDKPNHGYIQIPGTAYESLGITDSHQLESAQSFTTLMWPQGNPTFCGSVVTFAKVMREIELMALRMILEGLGIDKYFDSQAESTHHSLRLAEYGSPGTGGGDGEAKVALPGHCDPVILSLVYQYRIPGLEILWNGEWIGVPPATNSVNIQIGETLEAWTNGRLRATHHRVNVDGHETRYSSLFASYPKDGYMVTVPYELVDEEHPLLYKPFVYGDWINFRFSEEGYKAANKLEAYWNPGGLTPKKCMKPLHALFGPLDIDQTAVKNDIK